jgi:hypothetical protein
MPAAAALPQPEQQLSDAAVHLEPLLVPLHILLRHAGVDLVDGLQPTAAAHNTSQVAVYTHSMGQKHQGQMRSCQLCSSKACRDKREQSVHIFDLAFLLALLLGDNAAKVVVHMQTACAIYNGWRSRKDASTSTTLDHHAAAHLDEVLHCDWLLHLVLAHLTDLSRRLASNLAPHAIHGGIPGSSSASTAAAAATQ